MLNNLNQLIYLIQACYASQSHATECCEGKLSIPYAPQTPKHLTHRVTLQVQKIFDPSLV